MSSPDAGGPSNLKNAALNHRNMLLGGTTLAAASAIAAGNRVTAQAQQQPAAAPGGTPNIFVIFGDDIGQSNFSAYTFGLMGYRTRAQITSNEYYAWMLRKSYLLYSAQAIAGAFVESLKQYPPHQKPQSFNLDEVMERLKESTND
jgi:hypothetical protein